MKAKGTPFGNDIYGSCWRSRIECEGDVLRNVRDLTEEDRGLRGRQGSEGPQTTYVSK